MNCHNTTSPLRTRWWGRMALMMATAFFGLSTAQAQFVIVGTDGTNTNGNGNDPVDDYYNFMRYQVIYTAAELTGAGLPSGATITGLGWSVSQDNGPAFPTYTVRMAHTANANNGSHDGTALTTVFGPASYNPAVTTPGNHSMLTFGTNFVWNGTSNILVDVCTGSSSMGFASPYGGVRGSTGTGGSRYVRCDGCGSQCSVNTNTTNTIKPQIRFNYLGATPCAGTPAPGSVPATLTACPNGSVVINATGTSTDTGISFQWEEWDGSTWVNAVGGSGATTTSYTTPALVTAMQYRLRTTCANGGGTDVTNTCNVSISMTPLCYCGGSLPTSNTDDNTGLTRVVFNTIDQSSGGGPAYTDYTAVNTSVDAGANYNLAVQVNTAGNYTVYTKAWFDWDRNGVFTDPGEEYDLGSAVNVANGAPNASPQMVSVPMITSGPVIMRARATYFTAPVPCGNQNYSEAEDYTINVVACIGPPPTVSISGPATLCEGSALNLDGVVSGAADQYEWTGPGGFTASTEDASIGSPTPANSGTYTFRAKNGVNGCWSTTATHAVTVKVGVSGATANASDLTICDGDQVDLTSSATFNPPATILSENFNGLAPGWTQVNNSTGGTPANAAWSLGANASTHFGWNLSSNDASQFAFTDSDAQGSGSTTNTELNSPPFSLADYATAQLSFWQAYRDIGDAGDNTNVEVSTDGGFTWGPVIQYTSTQGAANAWVNAVLDLSAYAGQADVRIRFRYTATWDWGWAIDNVSVTGTGAALSYAWASTPAYFTSGVQNPTGVTVSPLPTDFTVTASAPNGCSATATVTVILDPTDTDGDSQVDCVDACPNDPNNDQDGDGICGDVDSCPTVFGQIGDPCDDGNCYTTGDVLNGSCVCAGTPVPCDTWTLTIESGANGGEISWIIQEDGGPCVLQTGGPYANNSTNNVSVCVPTGNCFKLTMNDAGGDGIVG
ncbi:MAG TPA: GEVED domain-containing protein, partial [Flavobacteriales bacterium]|nr:GEVED domain-containing protein [Flavobacteriales bacterium]